MTIDPTARKSVTYRYIAKKNLLYLELKFPHVILSCKVLVLHPKTLKEIHDTMLKEYYVQQIDEIGTKVANKPGIGVLGSLKGKCCSKWYNPSVVEKTYRNHT